VRFRFSNGVIIEVEDRCCENRIGASNSHSVHEMVEGANTA
jgi:hypothetical protein